MSLTKEEKAALVLEKANAKIRTRETWQTIVQLKKLLKDYQEIHNLWTKRFEKADRAIAMEEKLTVIESIPKEKKVNVQLSREQLEELLKELKEEGGE
jgi:hypothetical protein